MIVDHLNTSLTGGAAMAAQRLHESLLSEGVESRFWYRKASDQAANASFVRPLPPGPKGPDAVRGVVNVARTAGRKLALKWQKIRYLSGRSSDFELFSVPRLARETPFDSHVLRGDILHLHWVARMIDYPSFFSTLPARRPVVWTLHDMNPFTGGCHFSGNCEAFTTGCGNCPQLVRRSRTDLSRSSFEMKRTATDGKSLHIVTPSRWLTRQAQRSPIFSQAKSFHTIAYGLDIQLFAPRDRVAAKRKFGLPLGEVILGFGADCSGSPRKGIRQLLAALPRIRANTPFMGLVFGSGSLPKPTSGMPELRSVGYIDDPQLQAAFYAAVDIFVMPSLEDNLPQTGLEAMACGTPVIAFDAGGIGDYVRPAQTGLLASVGDVNDLAAHIGWLIDRPEAIRRMGHNARAMVCEEFHRGAESQAYIRLYNQLLGLHESPSKRRHLLRNTA